MKIVYEVEGITLEEVKTRYTKFVEKSLEHNTRITKDLIPPFDEWLEDWSDILACYPYTISCED